MYTFGMISLLFSEGVDVDVMGFRLEKVELILRSAQSHDIIFTQEQLDRACSTTVGRVFSTVD